MVVIGFSGAVNSQYYIDKYQIRFVGHDSSVSIVVNGTLVFAAEEERFNLCKHTAEIPYKSLLVGLEYCNLTWEDIDCFVFPWSNKPLEVLKTGFNHLIRTPFYFWPKMAIAGFRVIKDAMSAKRAVKELERLVQKKTNAKIVSVDHHMAHIASSFFTSPFDNAAILSIDGSGGYLSAISGEWKNGNFKLFYSVKTPDSIGILYGLFTELLGYRSGYDEYKVMGMAAYGDPNKYLDKVQLLLKETKQGFKTRYTESILNLSYCIKQLEKHFGIQQRAPEQKLLKIHFDLAASIQHALEIQVIKMLHLLKDKTSCKYLCLSGGVFQNTLANGKILESKLFQNIYIPPVPSDNGASLGAALIGSSQIYDDQLHIKSSDIGFVGPDYSEEIYLKTLGVFIESVNFTRVDDIISKAAELLASNNVLGWFQGRMEYGARALGNRSILASPLDSHMKKKLNVSIKNRESYRPFAASIPNEAAPSYFNISQESPYMQFVVRIKPDKIQYLNAINHFETCRVQTVTEEINPMFYNLLNEFGNKSGHPLLLNTSFNGKDQPIVCDPKQAIETFLNLGLDGLILGNYYITKRYNDTKYNKTYEQFRPAGR